jgi:hypothetical protein
MVDLIYHWTAVSCKSRSIDFNHCQVIYIYTEVNCVVAVRLDYGWFEDGLQASVYAPDKYNLLTGIIAALNLVHFWRR